MAWSGLARERTPPTTVRARVRAYGVTVREIAPRSNLVGRVGAVMSTSAPAPVDRGDGSRPVLTTALVALMAVGSGLSVACNYYVQPLLPELSDEFGASSSVVGLLVTVSQLGHVVGEIEKGRRCIELLPLKQHWRLRTEQQQ